MIKDILIVISIPIILVGVIYLILYMVSLSMKKDDWKATCSESPIISFEKFKILYDIDESRWDLWADYPHFKDNGQSIQVGLSFKDYCKYEKFYEDIIKKKMAANSEKAQIEFDNRLDKYLESKISKIQNDLQKNTEELKQRTENYKSDFDCINAEIKKVLQYHNIENAWIEDSEWGKAIHVPENISEYACKHLNKKGYIVVFEKEKIK